MTHYVVWKHSEKICLPSKSAVLLILYLSTREGECTDTQRLVTRDDGEIIVHFVQINGWILNDLSL